MTIYLGLKPNEARAAMVEETYAISDSFVSTALQHGLVSQAAAQRILKHAQSNDIAQSIAAFNLDLMDITEVQAVQLLQKPANLAPGYKLEALLGTGAMGMVFRARQVALDRDVALKTMRLNPGDNEKDTARINREARSIAKLQHPHIVSAYDAGVHQGRVFIAMEMIDGEDLSSYIKREGPLPELTTWRIARQVASALAHADAKGIVHRDVKPGNILLADRSDEADASRDEPLAKVTDFGLAYSTTDEKQLQMTATGATLGTPAYVAPEQLNDTHVDARADIYSLGATIVHMLAGQPPFHDCSPVQAIVAKTTGKNKWRDQLAGQCESVSSQLLLEMTESDPDERIGSYAELLPRIDEVLACLEGNQSATTLVAPLKTKPIASSKRSRISKRLVSLALAAGLAMVGLASLAYLWPSPAAETVVNLSQWKPAGLPRPLFNGLSVPLFPKQGSWRPHAAGDGSRVLAAEAGSQLTIPLAQALISGPQSAWQFRVSLQPQEQSTARVLISSAPDGRSITLEVNGESARLLEVHEGAEPTELETYILPTDRDESFFLACEISKLSDALIVRVNGERLGAVSLGASAPTSLVLSAEDGATYFADVDVVEMVRRVGL